MNISLKNLIVIYFVADKYKSGGSFVAESGKVRFIEEATGQLVFCNGLHILFSDIVKIILNIKSKQPYPCPKR